MIDTLVKLSGTRHVAKTDSKTITKDLKDIVGKVDGKISYTRSVKEEPVISSNDLMFLPERNSVVFRAGDPPVWNRNETILPMSFSLFKNTITQPGRDYSLQTIPTLSSAADFDVRMNQPDFNAMLEKRMTQAARGINAEKIYRETYGYSDHDLATLDPDVKATEIMEIISALVNRDRHVDDLGFVKGADYETLDEDLSDEEMAAMAGAPDGMEVDEDMLLEGYMEAGDALSKSAEVNTDLQESVVSAGRIKKVMEANIFAGSHVSRSDLVRGYDAVNAESLGIGGGSKLDFTGCAVNDGLNPYLVEAFLESKNGFNSQKDFTVTDDNELIYTPTGVKFIEINSEAGGSEIDTLKTAADDDESRVHDSDNSLDSASVAESNRLRPTKHFLWFLAEQNSWSELAAGQFDREFSAVFERKEEEVRT